MAKKDKDNKTNAIRFLDKHKINHKVLTYECEEFLDGVTIANKLGINTDSTFKTLVTVGKSGQYYVYMVPVARELDLKKAAKAVHEKSIQMTHVSDLLDITGYIRGGCSPLGMKKQFQTVIDATAGNYETIFFSGGRRGCQLEMMYSDLLKIIPMTCTDILLDEKVQED